MATAGDLSDLLRRIDGRGYGAYRDARGRYDFGECVLFVDRVQGDPYAAPSKVRVRVPLDVAQLPASLLESAVRRLGLGDFLLRSVSAALGPTRSGGGRRGSGKSGLLEIDAGAQEVLERTAIRLAHDWVEIRVQVGLPAAGRSVLGREAEELLCRRLPEAVRKGLHWAELDQAAARRFVECVENQESIRDQLGVLGLIAFVGDGAMLPRESGAHDSPMRGDAAVPFESPEAFAVEVDVPNPVAGTSRIRGMGVPRGVTLVVGGGYHGKSTLLRALERGVYPHIPGDGRELVVSARDLVKIRAEDGRYVERSDIHGFIDRLPGDRSTRSFESDDASGSTSQAANIVEAIEAGSSGLLLDEDTSATNFMIRDARMQALVHADHEPITPFIDRVRELYDHFDVSTVLVMGGCGDYFDVADRVVMLRDYRAHDATDEARAIAADLPSGRRPEVRGPMERVRDRIPLATSFDASRGRRDVRIDARGIDQIGFGETTIDLRCVEQLVDPSQTRAVGLALHLATRRWMDDKASVSEVLDALDALLDAEGLDVLDPFHRDDQHPGQLARPRRFEVAAAMNRLRTARMHQRKG